MSRYCCDHHRPFVFLCLLGLLFWLYKFVHQEPERKPAAAPAPVTAETNPLHAGDEQDYTALGIESPRPSLKSTQEQTTENDGEKSDPKADHGVGIDMCDLKAAKSHSGATDAGHFDQSNAEKQRQLNELKQDMNDTIG